MRHTRETRMETRNASEALRDRDATQGYFWRVSRFSPTKERGKDILRRRHGRRHERRGSARRGREHIEHRPCIGVEANRHLCVSRPLPRTLADLLLSPSWHHLVQDWKMGVMRKQRKKISSRRSSNRRATGAVSRPSSLPRPTPLGSRRCTAPPRRRPPSRSKKTTTTTTTTTTTQPGPRS